MENTKKNKKKDAFWRACRYLGPHRRIVIISVLCAFVVGGTFATGLGTLLPIMQVLINGDTIRDWLNRKIVEHRLGVRLADDVAHVRIGRLDGKGVGRELGLQKGQSLVLAAGADRVTDARDVLAALADPARSVQEVEVRSDESNRAVAVRLEPLPPALVLGQRWAAAIPRDPIKAIAVVLAFLMALSIFGNIVRFFQEYLSEKAAILAVRDIRRQLYDHVLHLHLSFFGQKGTSDVTSRLTQESQMLQDGMKGLLGNSVQEPIKAAMALGVALYLSWQLTLGIILFGPLMFVVIKKFGKKVRRAARAALQNSSTMLGQIDSSLGGIRVVKSTNAEGFERRKFRAVIDGLVHEQLRIARLEAFNTPVLELMTLVVVCCIVLYASYLVLKAESLGTSEFFTVMACLMGIGESLRKVSKINNILQKSNASATRLFEMIDLPVERPRQLALRASDAGNADLPQRPRRILDGVRREVSFEDVTFTYPGAKSPAVRNVSLRVEKGRSIAVVGRNGSGKTTLLALLPRFYEPDSGRILIDGTDIRQLTLPSLRKQIGIVTQDSVIFPGTIAENIAYALPLAKRDQIIAAAKRAFAHEFIIEKPNGYDAVLGGQGSQLSGGQKQRLCIARAILRQTPILILDEATSQVDAESEHLIQEAIEGLMHERTTFVIAHRASTIKSADSIIVLDRGQVVGVGKHQELLGNCITYRQLYERQFGMM